MSRRTTMAIEETLLKIVPVLALALTLAIAIVFVLALVLARYLLYLPKKL